MTTQKLLIVTASVFALASPAAFAQRGLGIGHADINTAGISNAGLRTGAEASPAGVPRHSSTGETARGPLNGSQIPATQVTQNAALSAKLQPLVPAGYTLETAASGFQSEGQFVAALHASQNLNIPFAQLKAQMTGSAAVSLGKAIHNLRPDLDNKAVKENVKRADRAAARDIRQTNGKQEDVSAQVAANSALDARIASLLPTGMTAAVAASGFRSEGQFLATLHVANNLNLSFTDLKARVVGGESLGGAIRALRPNVTDQMVDAAAKEAVEQAETDRAATSTSVSTTSGASVSTGTH